MPGNRFGIPRDLPPRLWVFLAGCLLSAVGSGVVAPFTAIYLRTARTLPISTVSLVLAVIAGGNVVASLAAGSMMDRFGVRRIAGASLVLAGIGFLTMGFATGAGSALGAAALIGIGGGGFYPAAVPILVTLTAPDQRRRAFSLRSLTSSVGMGLGSAIGGALLAVSSVSTFQALFVADAVSYFGYAVVIVLVLGHRVGPEPDTSDRPAAAAVPRRFLPDRPLAALLVLQTLIVLAGYGQFSTSVPLLLRTRMAVDPRFIGTLVAVNVAVVIALQLFLGKRSEGRSPARMLSLLGMVWALAWCCGLAAVPVRGWPQAALLVAMALLYGVGACLFQPNFQPLLTAFTPADRLGRASGYAASAWGVALIAASPVGVLLDGLSQIVLWIVLIVFCLAVVALAERIRRAIPADPAARPPVWSRRPT